MESSRRHKLQDTELHMFAQGCCGLVAGSEGGSHRQKRVCEAELAEQRQPGLPLHSSRACVTFYCVTIVRMTPGNFSFLSPSTGVTIPQDLTQCNISTCAAKAGSLTELLLHETHLGWALLHGGLNCHLRGL